MNYQMKTEELRFNQNKNAIRFSKTDDLLALRYYVENIGVTEMFDFFSAQDILNSLAKSKKRFEEALDLILKLLLKEVKTQAKEYIVNILDERREFCINAAKVLEVVEPSEEFMYTLTYKYISNPYSDHRFISLFFYYDGINKQSLYKGLVDGIAKGCNLDWMNIDKTTRNGVSIRKIFKRLIGTAKNPEELPLEIYRVLKDIKKVEPITSYRQFAMPKDYIGRNEEQEEFYAKYQLSIISRVFDSLSRDDSDARDDIAKALMITKNGKAHAQQTAWLSKKLFEATSRNEYMFFRSLMNDDDALEYVNRYVTKKSSCFKTFAKAYEGDPDAIEKLTQNELFLLFNRLSKSKQSVIAKKAENVFDKCIHYKDGKKEIAALFDIVMENKEFAEKYSQDKALYEKTLIKASLRKKYLEKVAPGVSHKGAKTCNILNHLFVKLWDGCVSVCRNDTTKGKNEILTERRQFLMSLVKDCGLILEVINRDKEGNITQYSAMTVNESSNSRPTFKTVSKRRAYFYFAAVVKSLNTDKRTLEKMKEFDMVFKAIQEPDYFSN